MQAAQEFSATKIVWHYPVDMPNQRAYTDELIHLAVEQGMAVNCALPSNTRDPEAACLDADGKPITTGVSKITFDPDTNSARFREEVAEFIRTAHRLGCTSLHQDNPSFLVFQQRDGCYADSARERLLEQVDAYYEWLTSEIKRVFGKKIPLSYNKKFHQRDERDSTQNKWATYFDVAMAEVEEEQNNPLTLFDTIVRVNRRKLGLGTVTTLKSNSLLQQKRHLAAVVALGAHGIVPYDVYMGPGKDRYFASARSIGDYFAFIRKHRAHLDQSKLADVYINLTGNSESIVRDRGNLDSPRATKRLLVTLHRLPDKRALVHVTNWTVDRDGQRQGHHRFTIRINKSALPFTPRQVTVLRPGRPQQAGSVQASEARWKITLNDVDVWGVAELKP
jgi:hypothetical protein